MKPLLPLAFLLAATPAWGQSLGGYQTCIGMGCEPENQFTAEEDRAICGPGEHLHLSAVTQWINVTWCCPDNGMCHQPNLRSIARRLDELQAFHDRNACTDRDAAGNLVDTGKVCKTK